MERQRLRRPGGEHAQRNANGDRTPGTISIIANTSASIEPLFALAYRRRVLGGEQVGDINPVVYKLLDRHGLAGPDLLSEILARGRVDAVAGIPESVRRLLVTALGISPDRHLGIQAAFQRHVDSSVSKTVNVPSDSTPALIARIYSRAWRYGLKGVTVYRYASRREQVLELGLGDEPHHFDHATKCDPEECRV